MNYVTDLCACAADHNVRLMLGQNILTSRSRWWHFNFIYRICLRRSGSFWTKGTCWPTSSWCASMAPSCGLSPRWGIENIEPTSSLLSFSASPLLSFSASPPSPFSLFLCFFVSQLLSLLCFSVSPLRCFYYFLLLNFPLLCFLCFFVSPLLSLLLFSVSPLLCFIIFCFLTSPLPHFSKFT